MILSQIIVGIFAIILNISLVLGDSLARGYNDDIHWQNLEDGLAKAQSENRMALVLIHKSWCGACKALKPKFATDKELEEASKDFVMINVMDDEEPKDKQYTPDGGYIPRILFLTPDGKVQNELQNKVGGNPSYKFYYPDTKHIIAAMEDAKKFQQGYSKPDEL